MGEYCSPLACVFFFRAHIIKITHYFLSSVFIIFLVVQHAGRQAIFSLFFVYSPPRRAATSTRGIDRGSVSFFGGEMAAGAAEGGRAAGLEGTPVRGAPPRGEESPFFPKPFLTLTLPSPEREEDEFVVPHTPHPVRSALVAVVVVVFLVIVVCSGKE